MKKLVVLMFSLLIVGCANTVPPMMGAPEVSAAVSPVEAPAPSPAPVSTPTPTPTPVSAPEPSKSNVMSAVSSASESLGADGLTQTVVNTAFAFSSLYNPQKQNMTEGVLLAQRVESTSVTGREGAVTKLETTAWVDGKDRYDTKLWTIYDCADGGWRSGDYYITSKYGQGGAESLLRAYNFKSGKYVYTYTVEPVTAEIYVPKDVIKRYVAYASKRGADSACRRNEITRDAIGAVTLADGNGQKDRIALESANDALARSPVVTLVDKKEVKGAANLMVWGPADFSNKSDVVRGFSVKLSFANGSEVIIPVDNDKFDIDRASLPSGIRLRRIESEK